MRTLPKAQKVQNVDGTDNKAGQILKAVDLMVNNNGEQALHAFYIADIGQDDFILGYPFLEASNPDVDWRNGRIDGFTTISMAKADNWQPILKGTRQIEATPIWVKSIPGWEEGVTDCLPSYLIFYFLFRTLLQTALSLAYITYLWNILAFSRDFHKVLSPSVPFYQLP